MKTILLQAGAFDIGLLVLCTATTPVMAADSSTNATPTMEKTGEVQPQNWNWHVQNTDIVQGYPGFSAKYSGPNSLPSGGETRESVSLDLMPAYGK